MSTPVEIVRLLREASAAYYSSNSLMDNDTYDGIVERLREIDPKNPYLTEVDTVAPPPRPDTRLKEIICITGHHDKAFEEKIIKKGLLCTTILSASITILIIPDIPEKETAKVRVAKELGMKVLTRAQFTEQYLS